jgi:hypothetical protein
MDHGHFLSKHDGQRRKKGGKIRNLLEILDSLMGCDLGNITARDERETTLT